MTTKADILLIAPEFALVSDDTFNLAISDADMLVGDFGNKTDIAKRYFAAHCLAVWTASSAAAGGAVSSESAGRVKISYAVPSIDAGWLALTKYGQMVLELTKRKKVTPFLV